jgi:hypothetical protein
LMRFLSSAATSRRFELFDIFEKLHVILLPCSDLARLIYAACSS